MNQVSCFSDPHSTPLIFLLLVFVGVKGIPLDFMDYEPPRRHQHNGIPFRRSRENGPLHGHHHHHPHHHDVEFTIPNENFDDQTSWDWEDMEGERRRRQERSMNHNDERHSQESWRFRNGRQNYYDDDMIPQPHRHRQNFHSDYESDHFNPNFDHQRMRRDIPEQFNDGQYSHKTRVESNRVRSSNTRNPLPFNQMTTRSETQKPLDRPPNLNIFPHFHTKEDQHEHETRSSQWRKFQHQYEEEEEEEENEERNPRELFHYHFHHMDNPLYSAFHQDAEDRSLNDGVRDLDQQFRGHSQSHKNIFQPGGGKEEKAVSPFPELSVVRFRSSSISLGDNLEIVRIELDISDGDENEETKLEEVEE